MDFFEKDITDKYVSVEDFAADIRQYYTEIPNENFIAVCLGGSRCLNTNKLNSDYDFVIFLTESYTEQHRHIFRFNGRVIHCYFWSAIELENPNIFLTLFNKVCAIDSTGPLFMEKYAPLAVFNETEFLKIKAIINTGAIKSALKDVLQLNYYVRIILDNNLPGGAPAIINKLLDNLKMNYYACLYYYSLHENEQADITLDFIKKIHTYNSIEEFTEEDKSKILKVLQYIYDRQLKLTDDI